MNTEDLAQKEIEEILKKYNLQFHYKLDFPIYRILPDEVNLALKVLDRHKMRIVLDFRPRQPEK